MVPANRIAIRAAMAVCVLAVSSSFLSCDGIGLYGVAVPGRQVWVATEPVQCLGNPWEQDWLGKPGNDYGDYPQDATLQNAILKDYYEELGIEVSNVISKHRYDATCDGCGCPRGDTLYLLVDREDADEMVLLGYRLESPRPFGF